MAHQTLEVQEAGHSMGSRRISDVSMRTDTTWRYSVFGPDRLGSGPMLFTGPDGIRDHRVSVEEEHRYVGEGTMSPEGTSDVGYLWRPASYLPFPRPKSSSVGEVGWGVTQYADWSAPSSGKQIYLGTFRQAVEDRHTHLYQNPCSGTLPEMGREPINKQKAQPRKSTSWSRTTPAETAYTSDADHSSEANNRPPSRSGSSHSYHSNHSHHSNAPSNHSHQDVGSRRASVASVASNHSNQSAGRSANTET